MKDAAGREMIVLGRREGFARFSGTDQHGAAWIQFEVDRFAEQEAGTCSMCEEEIDSGWLCLDGGDEVCDSHVIWLVDALEDEAKAIEQGARRGWAGYRTAINRAESFRLAARLVREEAAL